MLVFSKLCKSSVPSSAPSAFSAVNSLWPFSARLRYDQFSERVRFLILRFVLHQTVALFCDLLVLEQPRAQSADREAEGEHDETDVIFVAGQPHRFGTAGQVDNRNFSIVGRLPVLLSRKRTGLVDAL